MVSTFPARGRTLLVVLCGALALSLADVSAAPPPRLLAPELDGGVGWLGTKNPILLKDLRGKIVVFDFWTLC